MRVILPQGEGLRPAVDPVSSKVRQRAHLCSKPPSRIPAAPGKVVRAVVLQMAGLAEGREVAGGVVRGVVVEMAAGQHDARAAGPIRALEARPEGELEMQRRQIVGREQEALGHRSALSAAPVAEFLVPPEPAPSGDSLSAQVPDHRPMRPAAPLAASPGAIEPNGVRQLRPVDRIEPTLGRPDGHGRELAQAADEGTAVGSAGRATCACCGRWAVHRVVCIHRLSMRR